MSRVSHTLRILAETAYPPIAPGPRVRMVEFIPFLAKHGIEADYVPAFRDREYEVVSGSGHSLKKLAAVAAAGTRLALRRRPCHDGVWVHRLGFLTPLPRIEPRRHPDIYDLDDALFLGSISHQNRHFAAAKREAQRCVAYLRSAHVVIVGNRYLADRVRPHAARLEVVPSCVDCSLHAPRQHADRDVVTVGWIGSRTTRDYLRDVLPVFERLNANRVTAKLVLVGANLPVEAPWLEQRPWSLERQYEDLAAFDIGIMPLPDNEWTRGKCGYKLLQYFASAVPVVASPVGVNTDLVDADRGFLADSPEAWHNGLVDLAQDATTRRQMGSNGRSFVEREYSYERWAGRLADLMRSAVADPSRAD